jgi:hypothetical protein
MSKRTRSLDLQQRTLSLPLNGRAEVEHDLINRRERQRQYRLPAEVRRSAPEAVMGVDRQAFRDAAELVAFAPGNMEVMQDRNNGIFEDPPVMKTALIASGAMAAWRRVA